MFRLIELPYAMEGLEPVISAQTLSFHMARRMLRLLINELHKHIYDCTWGMISGW